jgi:hypothetical protein
MAEKGNHAVKLFTNTVPEAPQGPFKLLGHFQGSLKIYRRGSASIRARESKQRQRKLPGTEGRVEEAGVRALTKKYERLLNSLDQVEAGFLACWPKLQAESRKTLRAELNRLRMENKGLHGEQNLDRQASHDGV